MSWHDREMLLAYGVLSAVCTVAFSYVNFNLIHIPLSTYSERPSKRTTCYLAPEPGILVKITYLGQVISFLFNGMTEAWRDE
jgi:hypothetical protein